MVFLVGYGSSNYKKVTKIQISKIIKSGGFLARLLAPLLKVGLSLMKNVLQLLAKTVLIPLRLTAAASPPDAGIHKTILGYGINTLVIPNKEKKDIMKIVKSLKGSGLFLKGVTRTIENKKNNKKTKKTKRWISHFSRRLIISRDYQSWR